MEENENETGSVIVIAQPTPVLVDTSAMVAAISCASKDTSRPALNGVFVHRVDETLRIVATDGHRLFLHARERVEGEDEWPEWLAQGVILPTEGLKSRLSLLDDVAKVSYAIEAPFVELSDRSESCRFRLRPVAMAYSDYQPILDRLKAFDGNKVEEMTATAFDSKYFKAAGELAKALGSDAIRIHAMPTDQSPTLITFPSSEGSMLLLMPVTDNGVLSSSSMKVLAAPLQGTLAALRAHKTRWERKTGKAATQKVAEYEQRIAAIVAGLEGPPALPAPTGEDATETSPVALMTALQDALEEPGASLVSYRSKLSNGARNREMTQFIGDVNAALNGHGGLTLDQLADGVPVDDWFDAGLSAEEAAKRALDWRRIGSVLPPDEIQPGEADKPVGLLGSPARSVTMSSSDSAAEVKSGRKARDFDSWRAEVDREVAKRVGVGVDDLVDSPYHDWFDNGVSVKTAAARAIKNQKES